MQQSVEKQRKKTQQNNQTLFSFFFFLMGHNKKNSMGNFWFDLKWQKLWHETKLGWVPATTFGNATGHLWSGIGSQHESKRSIDPRLHKKHMTWKQQGLQLQCCAVRQVQIIGEDLMRFWGNNCFKDFPSQGWWEEITNWKLFLFTFLKPFTKDGK